MGETELDMIEMRMGRIEPEEDGKNSMALVSANTPRLAHPYNEMNHTPTVGSVYSGIVEG